MGLDAKAQKKEAHSSAQLLCLYFLNQHLNVYFESLSIFDLTQHSDVDILWVPFVKILFSRASFFSIIFYFKNKMKGISVPVFRP